MMSRRTLASKSNVAAPRSSRLLALAGAAVALGVGLGACSDSGAGSAQPETEQGSIDVVAAFYPLAFLAEQVGGDLVNVTDLTPPGGHAHDLELSPRQVATVGGADAVIYLGQSFQPAVETAVLQSSANALDGLTVVDDEVLIPGDAHVWLDPMQMAQIGDAFAAQLSEIDPAHAQTFRDNASNLRGELEQVDGEYEDALAECEGEALVTSHEAFGYMTRAYGLKQVGIMGINPDAEPSPKRLRELEAIVEDSGATTIFFETQTASGTEQRFADALSLQVGGLETLEAPPSSGDDYIGALRANLDSIREGLDCAK